MEGLKITGKIVTGQGEGAKFTNLDWVYQQFVEKLGIEPYPGTLNLSLKTSASQKTWDQLRDTPGIEVIPPDPKWCLARCYPIRIADRFPGAIICPDVPGYPENQVEIIAALPIREKLSLQDGTPLTLEVDHPLRVRAAIFDVDGTLVESLEVYRTVAEMVAAPYGIAITMDMVRHAMNTGQLFWEMILPDGQPDREVVKQLMRSEALRNWPDVLRKKGHIAPGLRDMLQTLKDEGIRLGIVTGSFEGALQPLIDEGLIRFFDEIVTGSDVRQRKPHPEGLFKCALALNIHPEDCVYIGDTPLDIQASKKAGMAAVGVLSGAGNSALLSEEGPDRIVFSTKNIPEVLTVTTERII